MPRTADFIASVFRKCKYIWYFWMVVYMYLHSKTCLQGTPLYPRGSVPTSQVSLRHRCPFITGVPSSQVSLHHRFPNMGKIEDIVLRKCPLIAGCPLVAVSLEDCFTVFWYSIMPSCIVVQISVIYCAGTFKLTFLQCLNTSSLSCIL